SGIATVSISVTSTNNARPVANADQYTIIANTLLSVQAPGVLANDTDADGNFLTASLANGVSHGTLHLNSDGSFTYLPFVGYSGTDTFSYSASDGVTNSMVVNVTITINASGGLFFSDDMSHTNVLAPWIQLSGTWAVTNGVLRGASGAQTYGSAYITN